MLVVQSSLPTQLHIHVQFTVSDLYNSSEILIVQVADEAYSIVLFLVKLIIILYRL